MTQIQAGSPQSFTQPSSLLPAAAAAVPDDPISTDIGAGAESHNARDDDEEDGDAGSTEGDHSDACLFVCTCEAIFLVGTLGIVSVK